MEKIKMIKTCDLLPERVFKPDNVQLFLYNAVLFNAHRIHFDFPYTTEVEHYPGLVLAGPLLGDWLTQTINEWIGEEGQLKSFEYSNRKAAFVGETLYSGGSVMSCNEETGEVKLEVYIKNESNEIITPGLAVVQFETESFN